MTQRKCIFCDTSFEPNKNHRTFCSKECVKRQEDKERPDIPKICKFCSVDFVTKKRTKIFCDRKCKTMFVRQQQRGEIIIFQKKCKWCECDFSTEHKSKNYCSDDCLFESKKPVKKTKDERTCGQCGCLFSTNRSDHRFCSKECAKSDTGYSITTKKEKPCVECGSIFVALGKYCSEKCRKSNRYSKHNTKTLLQKEAFLGENKCTKCEKVFDPACLAFHHLHDKKFILSRTNYGRYKKEELIEEITKTKVLCHNCHALQHFEMRCNEKQNLSQGSIYKKTLRNTRKKYLVDKAGGSCVGCGIRSDILDIFSFDHIKEKRFTLCKNNLGSRKWKDILTESEKCELLCLNCHFLKNKLSLYERRIPIRTLIEEGKINTIYEKNIHTDINTDRVNTDHIQH